MPDLGIAIALLALVTLVEASPIVRIPIGLLLAIAMLAYDAELLPIALIGAAGVTIARVGLAISARRGRDRLGKASPAMQAQREQLRSQLSGSPAYARITFLLAALPGGYYLEHMPWFETIYRERIELDTSGYAVVPDRPGWGFSFDPDAIRHYAD